MESDLGKLFVGGISWDTDENRLKEYFGQYGEVMDAMIMRDRLTGRARGFGFVAFSDPAVAERVVMDKHMIDGRMVEAKKAVPREDQHILNRNNIGIQGSPGLGRTKKIFVGGLASTVTESDFKNYFDQFGTITDVVVMYDHNTQRPRGFGFITYDSEDAVDRVLHKTFHELNGKMVEVKRAVPKRALPGPTRSLLAGNGYGFSRPNNIINSYDLAYNISSAAGQGRFNPVSNGRSGFLPFSISEYGMGMNMDPRLNANYGGNSTFIDSPNHGRLMSPYHGGSNSNRYKTPIGYNASNTRSNSLYSSTPRNVVWGSGSFNNAADPSSASAFLGTGGGNFGVSFGNSGANLSLPLSASQGGGSAPGFPDNGFGNSNYGLGGGTFGRNGGTNAAATALLFDPSTDGLDISYGDLYYGGSAYGDSAWRTPELEGSGSFGFELGNADLDVVSKTSEDYIGSYGVTNRQQNRGIAT
ncbi:hypothetical protein Nepgr_007628 [Nepenthes gracilis]|uniref:RRM domain-containing protein n=1 Tax=Nepenthes gracilis TaxID=150966 RepID=A0AAD3XIG9_NEPGR|nr:hypothetical protein Nepgr_007628 [Nepenthes gracilis]